MVCFYKLNKSLFDVIINGPLNSNDLIFYIPLLPYTPKNNVNELKGFDALFYVITILADLVD